MKLRSRILEFLPKDLILELNSICLDVTIPDNNTKVNKMVASLDKYDVNYSELGPGTNRFAILIDGYVFKIAMDKAGIRDNLAEFGMSQELQPFVIKVYECNGLIITTEYVTVISKEEFNNSKDEIRHILSYLADSYLLGDVGTITKNFMNWGYRDDNSLVILDFAYIYRVLGEEMLCNGLNSDGSSCETILEYDENFDKLICPQCRKKYTFHDIRRKISKEYESKELSTIKQIAYKVTKSVEDVANDAMNKNTIRNTNDGGNDTMAKHNDFNNEQNVDLNDFYLNALSFMKQSKDIESDDYAEAADTPVLNDIETNCNFTEPATVEEVIVISDENISDIEPETETETDEENTIDDSQTIKYFSKETVSIERTQEIVSGVAVFDADEPVTEMNTENKTPVTDCDETTNNTIFITDSTENVDKLRMELMQDLDTELDSETNSEEVDEYEELYDEIREENISRKYSSKQKKTLE